MNEYIWIYMKSSINWIQLSFNPDRKPTFLSRESTEPANFLFRLREFSAQICPNIHWRGEVVNSFSAFDIDRPKNANTTIARKNCLNMNPLVNWIKLIKTLPPKGYSKLVKKCFSSIMILLQIKYMCVCTAQLYIPSFPLCK